MTQLKASYRKTPGDYWEGVLRDEHGNVVWSCGHSHKCRDYNHSRLFHSRGAAMYCARDELKRRTDTNSEFESRCRAVPTGVTLLRAPF